MRSHNNEEEMDMSRRAMGAALALAAVAAMAAIPAVASARTYNITCRTAGTNPSDPTDITARLTCRSPVGSGRQTGTLVLPKATGKWTFRGGAFNYVGIGSVDGQTATSTIRLTRGTGRFRGCTGRGQQTYDLASARGTARVRLTCRGRIR
jgi:hypothetical protein